jgi:cyclopropane fatty-acyl-phospholipid synthase-like methyltransferase
MDRVTWLKQMRVQAETLYNHIAERWSYRTDEEAVKSRDQTTARTIRKFLEYMPSHSNLLSSGCGAGLYDGMLLDAGHNVVGTDFAEQLLDRARKLYPTIRYEKVAHHKLHFHNEFDGAMCIDALEHVFPEEWPTILSGFWEALKPAGMLYLTVYVSVSTGFLEHAYELSMARGLPVVWGEVVDEEAFDKVMATGSADLGKLPGELLDSAVYHYYPSLEQIRQWLTQAYFTIEDEHSAAYHHFMVRKI